MHVPWYPERRIVLDSMSVFGRYPLLTSTEASCAPALDRQHPRDLFDVKLILDTDGITPEIRRAFVVYLAGHNRPMEELLSPRIQDISDVFQAQSAGMTQAEVATEELITIQQELPTPRLRPGRGRTGLPHVPQTRRT